MEKVIYLDNNATTRIEPRVLEAMMPFLTEDYANAASTHFFGLNASDAVKEARKQVADLIKAETHEIVFTSGATESINVALKGVAEKMGHKGKHIVTVSTEHSAVLDCCKYLESKGFEISYLPVLPDGLVDLQTIKTAIRKDTILVNVMLVNNETGVIQPISEIAKLAHEAGAFFMTDATQALGKMEIDVDKMGIDILCCSGHKIYAPKGIGALFIRQRGNNRVKIPALIHGGGHERGVRSGTLNVPGIVGFGKACALANVEMKKIAKQVEELRDKLEKDLLKIDGACVNGNIKNRLYNVSNICFEGFDSDAIIMGLSNKENKGPLIAVSNGSACTSASIEPSHVLIAMGLSENQAFNSVRFSLGKFNTKEEIEIVVDVLRGVINDLKAFKA